MSASERTKSQHWRWRLTLWLWWMLANAIGGAIVGALEGGRFEFLATVVLTGPVIGVAQWLVLHRHIQHAGWWVLVSAVGWFLGANVSAMTNGVLDPIVGLLSAVGGLWEVFWINIIKEPVTSAGLGVTQWLVLRRHIQHAGWWVLASVMGGAMHGAVSSVICAVACQTVGLSVGGEMATAMSYSAGWAGYGTVTGIMLVWSLQNRSPLKRS